MAYKYLLFDLDGTIVDSGSGVLTSVKYALERCDRDIPDNAVLRKFIGPPLDYSFENFIGMDKSESANAVAFYREYYKEKGIFDCIVYDGIRELLKDAKESGYVTIVATSKPEVFAKRIIDHFGLADLFDLVVGASFDDSRKNKDQVIAYALDCIKADDIASEVIMIGDRLHDIEGAHVHSMKCIAVLYGYGSEEEFREYNADFIVKLPEDIMPLLRSI